MINRDNIYNKIFNKNTENKITNFDNNCIKNCGQVPLKITSIIS